MCAIVSNWFFCSFPKKYFFYCTFFQIQFFFFTKRPPDKFGKHCGNQNLQIGTFNQNKSSSDDEEDAARGKSTKKRKKNQGVKMKKIKQNKNLRKERKIFTRLWRIKMLQLGIDSPSSIRATIDFEKNVRVPAEPQFIPKLFPAAAALVYVYTKSKRSW